MSKSPMVYAGMATMPSRKESFGRAINSILPQVDRLFLFLDRFPPGSRIHHPKVTVLTSQEHGDLRANGKLLGLGQIDEPGYYFTADDDIAYPPDYVPVMIDHLSKLGPGKVAGLHGSILLRDGFESYLRSRMVVVRDRALDRYAGVDVMATCTCAFRTDDLRFDVRDWTLRNMVDLHFSIECEKRGLARFAVPRARGWVVTLGTRQPDSIYAELRRDDSVQTGLARQLMSMSRPSLERRPAR